MSATSDQSLLRILSAIRRRFRLLLFGSVAGGLLGLFYLHVAAPSYTATIYVTQAQFSPADPQRDGSFGGGGLLQLFTTQNSATFERFIEMLWSPGVLRRADADGALMQHIFSAEWDQETASWRPPAGWVAQVKQVIRTALARPAWAPPDYLRLAAAIERRITIDQIRSTSIYRVSYRDEDPETASTILMKIYSAADNDQRSARITIAQAYIDFIQEQLAFVPDTERRMALIDMLSRQMQIATMAKTGVPFAAEIVDGPHTSQVPSSPKPAAVLALSILAGFVFAGLTALARGRRAGLHRGGVEPALA